MSAAARICPGRMHKTLHKFLPYYLSEYSTTRETAQDSWKWIALWGNCIVSSRRWIHWLWAMKILSGRYINAKDPNHSAWYSYTAWLCTYRECPAFQLLFWAYLEFFVHDSIRWGEFCTKEQCQWAALWQHFKILWLLASKLVHRSLMANLVLA